MKRKILLLSILLLTTFTTFAQKTNPLEESYNYKRALEAMQNDEDISVIMQYLEKELEIHPKNGYAYLLQGVAYIDEQKLGASLEALNKSVLYLKKDKEELTKALIARAKVQMALDNLEEAQADFDRAVKQDPKNTGTIYERAEFFYGENRYEEADRDFDAIIRLEPGNTLGYMGKGRDALEQDNYEDALKMFDYAIKLEPDFARAYAFRGETYMKMKKFDEASNDLVMALDKGQDSRAALLLQEFKQPELNTLIAKVKVQVAKNKNDDYWPYYLGMLYEGDKQFSKAIDSYKTSLKIEPDPAVAMRIGDCYSKLGDYDHAIEYAHQAIELDSTETQYAYNLAHFYYSKGDKQNTLKTYDQLIENNPEEPVFYYARGFTKDLYGDAEGAIDDYTMCTVLMPDWDTPYRERADLLAKRGEKEAAEADFRKALELDTTGVDIGSAYCYLALGERDKIRPCIDSLLASPDIEGGDFYNIACIYSLMNEPDSALYYLRRSLENGYCELTHIGYDTDMDNIRNTEGFRQLISEYEEKIRLRNEEAGDKSSDTGEEAVSEVPFTKENGVYKVRCEVNSLPLHFIFDTGASSVSISMVEATFMMKNGYLTKDDVIGSQYFQDANGNVSEGTVINLRRVHLGDCDLENVKASVVRNQKAPILLGQSVLSRLGKVEIDNEARVLRIRYRK